MTAVPKTILSAIDIGSSAIRMEIAEVRDDGSLNVLENLKKGVQLGKDAFTHGYLSEESIRSACAALKDFKKVMDSYGVDRYRAVSTSAVRESTNSDTFLDRVLMSTGLDVEILDGSEESRLTYSAILESLRGRPDWGKTPTVLAEIGGGNSDVALVKDGDLAQAETFPLGAIRLREEMRRVSGVHEQQIKLLKRQVTGHITRIRRAIPIREASAFVAVGGDVRFAARILLGSMPDTEAVIIEKEALSDLVDSIMRLTADELVQKYSISYADAETLTPALLSYLQLLKETQATQMIISGVSIRTGVLLDLAPEEKGKPRKRLTNQIFTAARSLGRKYQYDEAHAERVREFSELIFDEIKAQNGLNDSHRLYLQVAALLHDIGLYVGTQGHHKHSHYLIVNSELFGLRQHELEIIANVARYHRRALPQRSHEAYMSLDRDERVLVSKLAAILRIANVLGKGHLQKIADLKIASEGDLVVLSADKAPELAMERTALAARSDLFNEIFGRKIILRDAPPGA